MPRMEALASRLHYCIIICFLCTASLVQEIRGLQTPCCQAQIISMSRIKHC